MAHGPIHNKVLEEREDYEEEKSLSLPLLPSIFGMRRIKRCQSCEEEIGVSDHVCKKEKESIDYIDYLVKLFGKKK